MADITLWTGKLEVKAIELGPGEVFFVGGLPIHEPRGDTLLLLRRLCGKTVRIAIEEIEPEEDRKPDDLNYLQFASRLMNEFNFWRVGSYETTRVVHGGTTYKIVRDRDGLHISKENIMRDVNERPPPLGKPAEEMDRVVCPPTGEKSLPDRVWEGAPTPDGKRIRYGTLRKHQHDGNECNQSGTVQPVERLPATEKRPGEH